MEGDEARVQSLDRGEVEPDGQMLSTLRSLLFTYCNLERSQFYDVNQSTHAAFRQPISSTLTIVKEIFRVKGRRSKNARQCELRAIEFNNFDIDVHHNITLDLDSAFKKVKALGLIQIL